MVGCFNSNGTRSKRMPMFANTVCLSNLPALGSTIHDSLPWRIWNIAKTRSGGSQSATPPTARFYRWSTSGPTPIRSDEDPADIGAQCIANRDSVLSGGLMNNEPIEDNEMPAEIDFSKGVHGLHHIPSDAKVLMPASIELSLIHISEPTRL